MTQQLSVSQLPERLLIDLAVGADSMENICAQYGLTDQDISRLENDSHFQKRLGKLKRELTDDGTAITARAKHWIAELGLSKLHDLAHDPDVAASVQHDCVKTFIKLAGLDKGNAEQDKGSAATIVIEHPTGPIQVNAPDPKAKEDKLSPPLESVLFGAE